MPDGPPSPPQRPPVTSRMPYLIPFATLIAGLGAGFGGASYASGSPEVAVVADVAVAEGATDAPTDSAAAAGSREGSALMNLGAFTVNLRGSGGGRVLRLEVQVECAAAQAAGLKLREPQLRDSIITAVSDYTWSELEGTDGKTRLRDELIARVNGVSAPIGIDRLYFTQFVVQ